MGMTTCKDCGKEISSSAKECPHCGARPKKRRGHTSLIFILIIVVIAIIGSLIDSSFDQIGYFKENKLRVFSIFVKDFEDTDKMWGKIESHAKRQMYSEGGATFVFYFKDRNNTPDVTLVGAEFDKRYERYCVAGYWKYADGSEKFVKYPFE